MKIYDNGWYFIIGMKYRRRSNCHYFFNDKLIHSTKGIWGSLDYSKRRSIKISEQRRCKKCIKILDAYSTIGLENRLI